MPSIALEADLYDRIEKAASEQQADVTEMLKQAVERYLWDLERRKISEESKIYHPRHSELKKQYLGQYIAMHQGQVVDYDEDFPVLRQRIRQTFKDTPIMITLVDIVLDNLTLPNVFVVGDEQDNEIILGRNILNKFRFTLDGPNNVTNLPKQ